MRSCLLCDGTGKDKDHMVCPECNGTGSVEEMPESQRPRIPTSDEIVMLSKFISSIYGISPEEELEQLLPAYIAVFPEYVTDSPGFVGTIFVIVYGGAPNIYEVISQDSEGTLRQEKAD